MNRRHFLTTAAGVGTAPFAGCFGSAGGGPWYDLSFRELGSDFGASLAVTPNEQSDGQQAVMRKAAADGTAYTYGWTPFDGDGEDAYAAWDGTYYRVTAENTGGRKAVERFVVYGRPVADDEQVDAVNHTAFPVSDRTALKHAIAHSHENDASSGKADEHYYVLHDVNASESELVPDPEHRYVAHGEDAIELVVEKRTVTEDEYAVTATAVADSPDAFDAYARDSVLDGDLSDPPLPDEQAALVREALADEYDSYGEEVPLSDAFVGLLRRCGYAVEVETSSDGDHADTEVGGDEGPARRYVHFDGRYYATTISKAVA